MKIASRYLLLLLGIAALGMVVLVWFNERRNASIVPSRIALHATNQESQQRTVENERSVPPEVDTAGDLEAALKKKGKGNLKVYTLPSRDPAYYESILSETDSIVPDADYLKSSPRPNVFRKYIHEYLTEPISSEELRFLESKLRESEDEDIRIQCAALLYRYGVAIGEEYLASRLEASGDRVTAATILALNKSERHLNDIIDVVYGIGSSDEMTLEPFGFKLIQALGNWENEAVGIALYELSTRTDMQTYLALALAEHSIHYAVDEIATMRQRYPSDIGVHQYSVALYLMTGEAKYMTEIAESLIFPLADRDEWAVPRAVLTVEALAKVQNEESVRLLKSVVENMAGLPSLEGNLYNKELLRTALISLASGDQNFTPGTIRILQDGLEKLPNDKNLRLSVAYAVGVGRLEMYPVLKVAIGVDVLNLATATESLRELPPYYLPDASRGVLGLWQGGV